MQFLLKLTRLVTNMMHVEQDVLFEAGVQFSQQSKHFSDVDKKNPWKGLESRAGNLLGAITMPLFAAHVYVNFR